jgi:tryptophan 2,3-dioxygenase
MILQMENRFHHVSENCVYMWRILIVADSMQFLSVQYTSMQFLSVQYTSMQFVSVQYTLGLEDM